MLSKCQETPFTLHSGIKQREKMRKVCDVRALRILHSDNHVLAVYKPAGVPTMPDASKDASLYNVAKDWVKETFDKKGQAYLGIVHRLDRPVSGVVVFGRTSKGASRMSASFRDARVRKTYVALSERAVVPPGHSFELEQWLLKDRKRNIVSVVNKNVAGARVARTRIDVLAVDSRPGGTTLMRLRPHEGRSHQLRVACASVGLPILGDKKYDLETRSGSSIHYGKGKRVLVPRGIALHALELRLQHPMQKSELYIDAPQNGWPVGAVTTMLNEDDIANVHISLDDHTRIHQAWETPTRYE